MVTQVRAVDRVVPEAMFVTAPRPGDIFVSQRGGSLFSVMRVRKVLSHGGASQIRLTVLRMRKTDIPDDITPQPWPEPRKQRNRAAEPVNTSDKTRRRDGTVIGPMVSKAKQQTEQRRKIIGARYDETDHRQKVGHAVEGDWSDPDDIDPRARASPRAKAAKVIHGLRARDVLAHLSEIGTISRSQKIAGQRFRSEWELGELGLKGSRNLGEEPGGFGPGAGPSEARLVHLETFQATCRALRVHNTSFLMCTVCGGEILTDYAARRQLNRSVVTGMLLSGLNLLRDIYKEVDEAKGEREPVT